MLDSLVRVSRRVLKVPKAIASQIGYGGRFENIVANSHQRSETAQSPITDVHLTRLRRVERFKAAALNLSYTVERADRGKHEGPRT